MRPCRYYNFWIFDKSIAYNTIFMFMYNIMLYIISSVPRNLYSSSIHSTYSTNKRQTFENIISTNTFYIIQQVVMPTVILRCRWFQTVWYRTTTITTIIMQVTWFPLTWRTWEFVLKNIIWTHLTCSRLADLIYYKLQLVYMYYYYYSIIKIYFILFAFILIVINYYLYTVSRFSSPLPISTTLVLNNILKKMGKWVPLCCTTVMNVLNLNSNNSMIYDHYI